MDNNWLPADENLESAIIGSMLYDDYGLDIGLSCLKADDFFFPQHKTIFEKMAELKNQNNAVTVNSIIAALLNEVSGEYIAKIFDKISTSAGTKTYCNQLLEMSYRRRSITAAQKVIDAAQKNDVDVLKKAVEEMQKDGAETAEVEAVPEILERVIADITEKKKNGSRLAGYSTGFDDLDDLISGIENKKLYVIAARPAMGKSSAILNICQHIAKKNKDKNVVFFSLEMPKKSIVLRLYSSALNISNEHFKFNILTDDELLKIREYTPKFAEETANFYIEDDGNTNIFDIQQYCRKLKRNTNKEMALIAIDYLQIMSITKSTGNRAIDLGEVSRAAVMLAKEFDCPVVLLSQVNRVCETRQNKRPMLSDLKESGNIEQDADTVIFIYRDEIYNSKTTDKNAAEFIIAKQRDGSLGTVKLDFIKHTTSFKNRYYKRW